MNDYIFDETSDLGGVVSNIRPFCLLTKQMAVPTWQDIVGDHLDPNKPGLAGRKFSKLCGFTFKSSKPGVKYPIFQFVYVPKLRGTFAHNQDALSGWYCWKLIAKQNREVTSLRDMYRIYGFNVAHFVFSDVFNKYVTQFKINASYALANQVQQLVNASVSKPEYKELVRHVNAVKDSLNKIFEVQSFIRDKTTTIDKDDEGNLIKTTTFSDPHVKLAYNANDTYSLNTKGTRIKYKKPDNNDSSINTTKDNGDDLRSIAYQKAAEMISANKDEE